MVGGLGKLGRKKEKDQLKVKKPTTPLRLFVGRARGCSGGGEKEKRALGK